VRKKASSGAFGSLYIIIRKKLPLPSPLPQGERGKKETAQEAGMTVKKVKKYQQNARKNTKNSLTN
jgi:hypothetical protein